MTVLDQDVVGCVETRSCLGSNIRFFLHLHHDHDMIGRARGHMYSAPQFIHSIATPFLSFPFSFSPSLSFLTPLPP